MSKGVTSKRRISFRTGYFWCHEATFEYLKLKIIESFATYLLKRRSPEILVFNNSSFTAWGKDSSEEIIMCCEQFLVLTANPVVTSLNSNIDWLRTSCMVQQQCLLWIGAARRRQISFKIYRISLQTRNTLFETSRIYKVHEEIFCLTFVATTPP